MGQSIAYRISHLPYYSKTEKEKTKILKNGKHVWLCDNFCEFQNKGKTNWMTPWAEISVSKTIAFFPPFDTGINSFENSDAACNCCNCFGVGYIGEPISSQAWGALQWVSSILSEVYSYFWNFKMAGIEFEFQQPSCHNSFGGKVWEAFHNYRNIPSLDWGSWQLVIVR